MTLFDPNDTVPSKGRCMQCGRRLGTRTGLFVAARDGWWCDRTCMRLYRTTKGA